MIKKNKLLLAIFIVLFGLFVFWVIYLLIPRSTIIFETAPQKVNIKISNKTYQITNGEKINIKPGKYSITVSRSGFENFKKNISINNRETLSIIIVLIPKTDAAKKLLDNTESQNVIFHYGEQKYTKETDQMSKNYPIMKILPIYAKYYTVYPCGSQKYPSDTTKSAICVSYTPQSEDLKPYVFKDINSRGYDLNKYEVIWIQQ